MKYWYGMDYCKNGNELNLMNTKKLCDTVIFFILSININFLVIFNFFLENRALGLLYICHKSWDN